MMDSFNENLKDYLIDIDLMGYSENTIRQKKYLLGLFPKWLDENGKTPLSDEEYFKCFKEFLYFKKSTGVGTNYIYLLITTQKQFNKFLGVKWLDKMSLPKKEKALPKIIASEDYGTLISVLENRECKSDYCVKLTARNLFILKLLYHTGLRVSELTSLRKIHFNTVDKTIKIVNGKGGKSRMVLFNDDVLDSYDKYIKCVGELDDDDYLIVNFSRGEIKHNKLTTKAIANIIDNVVDVAGIDKKISPHQFRHAYATNLVKAGMNIRAVQMLMGHSSLETTQIYVNLTLDDIKNEYGRLSL